MIICIHTCKTLISVKFLKNTKIRRQLQASLGYRADGYYKQNTQNQTHSITLQILKPSSLSPILGPLSHALSMALPFLVPKARSSVTLYGGGGVLTVRLRVVLVFLPSHVGCLTASRNCSHCQTMKNKV